MEKFEFSAKTVDEAIKKSCLELGTASDQLEIEIINEGSTGFLGFGSKPAMIRVSKKVEGKDAKAEKAAPAVNEASTEKAAPTAKEASTETAAPAANEASASVSHVEKTAVKHAKSEHAAPVKKPVERSEEELAGLKASAEDFLKKLFDAMKLPVTLEMNYEKESDVLAINFVGKDMGILIGKRGQTLDSLQYLVSIVVNKGQKEYIRIKLDTEDYRRRRKETLENLAYNIARKVKKTRRPVSLEPMNPYERRIIHSVLQNVNGVETYSEGNEPYRHVVVTLKSHSFN